ncbi:transposase [Candidatus Venteria ishoeyi]|uniref:IS66 family transposase n=1 Tax=Candidatus Venteria ishoeyi TaxID=1899563 RepID=UPI0025A5D7D5|nr:transposase [Candidatus Venteria ishoeyi]MDM8548343.1 transposase [Candidatus Venteria ishoeyi]
MRAFHQHGSPPFPVLICDDAPQFKKLTEHLGLCWIHEGRHYKKLKPLLLLHRQYIELVLGQLWDYYHELLAYKQAPSPVESERLSAKFDTLFSQKTGYSTLDDRLALTLSKKKALLLVLQFPQIPLHNNPAELGAREQTRRRDISLQNKNDKGTQAKDTMMTVTATARKLEVNLFDYIYDKLSKTFKLPSLASMIQQKSQYHFDSS